MRPLRTLDHLSLALAIHEARSATPWDDASDHARDDAIACAIAAAGWITANVVESEDTFVPLSTPVLHVLAGLAAVMEPADVDSDAVEAALADRLAVELSRKSGLYGDEPEGAAGETFDSNPAETRPVVKVSLAAMMARPNVRLVPREG
jgi:hypothetical protein